MLAAMQKFVSFVFAAEDTYPTDTLVMTDQYGYLYYLLRQEGFQNIYFFRSYGNGYLIHIYDEKSAETYNRTAGARRSEQQLHPAEKLHLMHAAAANLFMPRQNFLRREDGMFLKILTENSKTAIVMDLAAVNRLVSEDDCEELIDWMIDHKAGMHTQKNSVIFMAGLHCEESLPILRDRHGMFFHLNRGKYLVDDIPDLFSGGGNPCLYHELAGKLRGNFAFLNAPDRRSVRRIVERAILETNHYDVSGLVDAQRIYTRLYGRMTAREKDPRLPEIGKDNFYKHLLDHLKRPGILPALAQEEETAFSHSYGTSWEIGDEEAADAMVTSDRYASAFTDLIDEVDRQSAGGEELRQSAARLRESAVRCKMPRCKEPDAELVSECRLVSDKARRALRKQDAATVLRAAKAFEFLLDQEFLIGEDKKQEWKCLTAYIDLMTEKFDTERLVREISEQMRSEQKKKQENILLSDVLLKNTPQIAVYLDRMKKGMPVNYGSEIGQRTAEYLHCTQKAVQADEQLESLARQSEMGSSRLQKIEDEIDQLDRMLTSARRIRETDISGLMSEIRETVQEDTQKRKSKEQSMYDLRKTMQEALNESYAGDETDYVTNFRRYQEMVAHDRDSAAEEDQDVPAVFYTED